MIARMIVNRLQRQIDALYSRVTSAFTRADSAQVAANKAAILALQVQALLFDLPIVINFFAAGAAVAPSFGALYIIGTPGARSVGPPVPPITSALTNGYAFVLPVAGVLSGLSVNVAANSLNGPVVFQLYQNGIATPVTATYLAGQTGAVVSTGFSVSCAAGDVIWLIADTTGASAGNISGVSATFVESLPIPTA